MQRIFTVCLLLASMLYGVFSATGQLTNQWRVSTKVRTVGSQKYLYEYTYSNDGRIQTVKQYSATGALIITISDFKFDKNGKPSYYLVNWNREGLSAKIYLEYDDNRRLINLEKVLDGNKEKTVFNYRYSGNTVTVFEQNPPSQKASNSNITYYNDNGDYTITTADEASNSVKSVITLKKNPVPSPENEPDKFFGGYEAPGFLGIKAHASEPEITIKKNEKGLIVSRFITTTNSVEYTYTKINSSVPESENAVTTITTNINCEEGKRAIEGLLKSQDGVKSAAVDIKTGKLKLDYSSDGTPLTQIISLINDAGFDADRVKSTNGENNPCAAKPSGNNITTITTNINCEEGKRIIERILKSQEGVKSAAVDIKTGKLKLDYNSDGTPLTQIIFLINDAGFDADRVKSKNIENNPCKTSISKDVNSLSKDVYVAGFESNGSKIVAKVWKNGVATSLTNGTNQAGAFSIFVTGSQNAIPKPPTSNITIIQTNINCEEGKTVIDQLLTSQNGVKSAAVDIKTGKLKLEYSSNGTPLKQIISLINDAGFDADRLKSTNAQNNPCAKKPENAVTNIQTNINCQEGKQKVESLLKEQNGVINVTIDIRSGKLVMEYNKADISAEVITRIINNTGFDADRKKSTTPVNNPCIKKPDPVEKESTLTIQTNINCEEGKQKVESLLKDQNGLVKATVDFRTGKLEITYKKDGFASGQIIRLINNAGFDADKTKSKNPENNPCIKNKMLTRLTALVKYR